MNFATLKNLTIPEGVVTQITDASGMVIWAVSGGKVILEVAKFTSDTIAGETTYTGEQFILLDIYLKTNGTVSVTYGGLTKTITDTSGAEEPNAQQVFFGTFNGVSDSVVTPASGELTIEGDYYAFAEGSYTNNKSLTKTCTCITNFISFGKITVIPDNAYGSLLELNTSVIESTIIEIPISVLRIGYLVLACNTLKTLVIKGNPIIGKSAFSGCTQLETVKMLSTEPPNLIIDVADDGTPEYDNFNKSSLKEIIVPKGCGATYKAAEGWSTYADYIVEES